MTTKTNLKTVPIRVEPHPSACDTRELWCPCDYKTIPPVIGIYLCPCGWTIDVNEKDVNWLNEEKND